MKCIIKVWGENSENSLSAAAARLYCGTIGQVYPTACPPSAWLSEGRLGKVTQATASVCPGKGTPPLWWQGMAVAWPCRAVVSTEWCWQGPWSSAGPGACLCPCSPPHPAGVWVPPRLPSELPLYLSSAWPDPLLPELQPRLGARARTCVLVVDRERGREVWLKREAGMGLLSTEINASLWGFILSLGGDSDHSAQIGLERGLMSQCLHLQGPGPGRHDEGQ